MKKTRPGRRLTRPKKDLAGKVYNKLKVIKFVSYDKNRKAIWLCECECGNKKKVAHSNLISGHVRSCGCLAKQRLKKLHFSNRKENIGFLAVLRDYKRGAKQRDLDYRLTDEQVKHLTQQKCFYCGIEPSSIKDRNGQHLFLDRPYIYNGIDRIDNNKGYTLENCVTCCKECNWAKGSSRQEDFLNWVNRITTHQLKQI